MNDLGQCEGETIFGFTVKLCDQPATVIAVNTPNEVYHFCARHHYYWLYGHYPPEHEIPVMEGRKIAVADAWLDGEWGRRKLYFEGRRVISIESMESVGWFLLHDSGYPDGFPVQGDKIIIIAEGA